MKDRVRLTLAAVLALAMHAELATAQNVAGTSQMHAAVINAIRDDAPRTNYVLYYDARLAAIAPQVAQLTGVRAVQGIPNAQSRLPGADTVAMKISVDSIGSSAAAVTVDIWGSLAPLSALSPTSYWVQRRVHLVKKGQAWVVSKVQVLIET